ncbi:lipoyltransferase [Xylona heveae TC161]|uniref:Putative lipoate-protein ligase A n=1 Tax=Xylona heveae (strain CBS 132557 / TC161) TaxID=1328760 RepID=A0A165J6L5_XYLHT|nr:lipoyltransferase [Xylona heveae TC161]KZF25805.1 lipoyltransferase [Xylona heveae TC161]
MAPSRGLSTVFSILSYRTSHSNRVCSSIRPQFISRAYTSIPASSFVELVTRPTSKHQIYISRSLDPYLNLSIEHFLLQRTSPESVILFLYTNRPSIIIGRNQNPWVEVNLRLLNAAKNDNNDIETEPPSLGDVWLVRRRSGGGTVFHDEGNVNYSVICPPAEFARDKHAEMVVRGLRNLGIDRARVNERHDIVLDQGSQRSQVDEADTHVTPYTSDDRLRSLKISGSAFKLTRHRSLHHGTCLLSSPNLNIIPDYLHAPAKPYIKARGVESVSSPVGNVGLSNGEFERAVVEQFCRLHNVPLDASRGAIEGVNTTVSENDNKWVSAVVDEELASIPEIAKGMDELKSLEWTFLQTPQFVLSSHPTPDDPRERPTLDSAIPSKTQISLKSRSGVILESDIHIPSDGPLAETQAAEIHKELANKKIHEIDNWEALLGGSKGIEDSNHTKAIGNWLAKMFGKA